MAYLRISKGIIQTISLLFAILFTSFVTVAQTASVDSDLGLSSKKSGIEWSNRLDESVITPIRAANPSRSAGLLLTTFLPNQYASMAPDYMASAQHDNNKGIEIKSSRGTVLMTLFPDQVITIQAMMMGKIHNESFMKNFVMQHTDDLSRIEMHRVLLQQLLALHFNRHQNEAVSMDDFRLEFGKYLVTQRKDRSPSVNEDALMPCGVGLEASSVYSWKLPASMEALIGADNSIRQLNDVVVEVLAGERNITKTELIDLGETVRIVNEAFENGRFFLGWSNQFITCSNSWILRWNLGESVAALPVNEEAFTTTANVIANGEEITLEVKSQTSSRVLVEIYTAKGSRISKCFHGQLETGSSKRFQIKPSAKKQQLIYKVTADGRTYSGLIP